MGAKHSFRSPNGGGVPFCMLPGCSPAAPFLLASMQIFRQSGQNRAKVNFFLLALVFSRENRRPKTAKVKIYLSFEGAGLPLWLSLCGGDGVHWVQVVGASRLQDLPDAGGGPPVVCSLPFGRLVALLAVQCT